MPRLLKVLAGLLLLASPAYANSLISGLPAAAVPLATNTCFVVDLAGSGTTQSLCSNYTTAIGALAVSSNLSDLGNAATARTNLGLAAIAAAPLVSNLTTGWPTAGDLMLAPASGAPSAYAGTTAGANQFMTGLSAAGVGSFVQPAFSNLSGSATFAQMPAVTGPAILGRVTNTSGAPSAAYTPSNGVDATVPMVHGATVLNDCAKFSDTAGTLVDSGGVCGGTGTPVVFVGAAAGAANAYTIASPTPGGYTLTNQFVVRTVIPTGDTNTGPSTLNVNATSVLPIVTNSQNGLAALVGGELIAGLEYDFTYSTSTATACASSCYVAMAIPSGGTQAGTTQTISASQWAGWTVFTVTTAGQTLTLPASSGLSSAGGIVIMTIGQSATLAPNAADAINGGTAGASVTVAAGVSAMVVKSSAGNISASPLTAGSGASGANPTATAGPTAIDGVATTFMRSDAAPQIQVGSATQEGILQCGSGTTCTSGTISVSGGGAPAPTSGYLASHTYGAWPGAYETTAGGLNAGFIRCQPLTIYAPGVHVDTLSVDVTTAAASTDIALAIYNSGSNGLPSTLVVNTGSLATTAAGVASGTITSTALTAGNYWLCAQIDTAGASFIEDATTQFTNGTASLLGSDTAANYFANTQTSGGISGIPYFAEATYGTWPSLSSLYVATQVTSDIPAIVWHTASVP